MQNCYHFVDHILDNAENLYERWPALDLTVKRRIVEELTQSIVIDTEDITIKFGYNPIILPILFVNPPNEQHNVIVVERIGTKRNKRSLKPTD